MAPLLLVRPVTVAPAEVVMQTQAGFQQAALETLQTLHQVKELTEVMPLVERLTTAEEAVAGLIQQVQTVLQLLAAMAGLGKLARRLHLRMELVAYSQVVVEAELLAAVRQELADREVVALEGLEPRQERRGTMELLALQILVAVVVAQELKAERRLGQEMQEQAVPVS
jgi:hypothetical protein